MILLILLVAKCLTPSIIEGLSSLGALAMANLTIIPSSKICKNINTMSPRTIMNTNDIKCQS